MVSAPVVAPTLAAAAAVLLQLNYFRRAAFVVVLPSTVVSLKK